MRLGGGRNHRPSAPNGHLTTANRVPLTLDYASPAKPPAGPGSTRAAPLVAICGAALSVFASISNAQSVIGPHGGCGTGREQAKLFLLVLPPVLCSLPALACQSAAPAKLAMLICRCSVWSCVAAWITACVFAFR